MTSKIPACFKAYDIRGKVPDAIDGKLAHALGTAIARKFSPKRVAIGHDPRLSGPMLEEALAAGLRESGVEVHHLGLCGTEETYFAAANCDYDLCVMITGSHNPADENGFKIVRRGAIPVSGDTGLHALGEETGKLLEKYGAGEGDAEQPASCIFAPCRKEYLDWLLDYSGFSRSGFSRNGKPAGKLKVVADAGNGSAGPVLKELARRLPFEFVILNGQPDGAFPNGVPNPLLPERRKATADAVIKNRADLGVAFDGDFDRCFFYDSAGNFVEGYYLVGLFASELLKEHPGSKIIHDPRVYWNTRDIVTEAGGIPVMSKTGHAFIKERMRAENALYGGEMSAHHYFRDFAYCDSGMLAMLLMLKFIGAGNSLEEYAASRMQKYPCSGEINFRVPNGLEIMERAWKKYEPGSIHADKMDGVNIEFQDWRFNMRNSNTEPLLRLNLESRADRGLMLDKLDELTHFIEENGGRS